MVYAKRRIHNKDKVFSPKILKFANKNNIGIVNLLRVARKRYLVAKLVKEREA